MSEQVSRYTNTEAIRACLGVDNSDVPDSYILDANLGLELTVDLGGWLTDHDSLFSTGIADGAAAADALIAAYIKLYGQWFCAHEVVSRYLAFPQITSDGKNQINRFANIDLSEAKTLAASRMAKYRALLDSEINGTTAVLPPVLRVSVPDYDPIAGA